MYLPIPFPGWIRRTETISHDVSDSLRRRITASRLSSSTSTVTCKNTIPRVVLERGHRGCKGEFYNTRNEVWIPIKRVTKAWQKSLTLTHTRLVAGEPNIFLFSFNLQQFLLKKSETSFVTRTQILCPATGNKMLHARANRETLFSARMCPRLPPP